MSVGNPVRMGLVAKLARPGGNLTGFSNLIGELVSKRLDLLVELVPRAGVNALLANRTNPLPRISFETRRSGAREGSALAVLVGKSISRAMAAVAGKVRATRHTAGALFRVKPSSIVSVAPQ